VEESSSTARLQSLGATIFIEHSDKNIVGADVCVVSSAIQSNNPELVAARHSKIPVVPRALMLAELMRFKKGVAIAGSHGKTTTTSLVASILASSNLDPTYVIGGRLSGVGLGARLGCGEFLVAEADESDGSFLNLSPTIAAVTNIDRDHLEHYGHDFTRLKQAFISFIHRLPFYSSVVLCIEDPNIREIIPFISRPIVRVGFEKDSDIRAKNIKNKGVSVSYIVEQKNFEEFHVQLPLPGLHNVLNSLVAIGIARELEIDTNIIQKSLENFSGVDRRFQYYGEVISTNGRKFSLVDDYGHHPTEIKATLNACKVSFPKRRLILVFQPHRFSRTRDLFEDFVRVLIDVDILILLDVYPAGEEPIPSADSKALSRTIRLTGRLDPIFSEDIDETISILLSTIENNDVILVMGAGSIGRLSKSLITKCSELKCGVANE
jgi:UDP-N-acetylmuramate--alanine ligase